MQIEKNAGNCVQSSNKNRIPPTCIWPTYHWPLRRPTSSSCWPSTVKWFRREYCVISREHRKVIEHAFPLRTAINSRLMRSTGVGFARMESREKCEQIIQIFNGTQLQGAKDPLLVKFADGGSKKKNNFKSPDPNARAWREVAEGVPVAYDPSMQQNGIGVNVGAHIGVPAYGRYGAPQVGGFAMPGYVPGYMMAQPLQQVDDQVSSLDADLMFEIVFWFQVQFAVHARRTAVERWNRLQARLAAARRLDDNEQRLGSCSLRHGPAVLHIANRIIGKLSRGGCKAQTNWLSLYLPLNSSTLVLHIHTIRHPSSTQCKWATRNMPAMLHRRTKLTLSTNTARNKYEHEKRRHLQNANAKPIFFASNSFSSSNDNV